MMPSTRHLEQMKIWNEKRSTKRLSFVSLVHKDAYVRYNNKSLGLFLSYADESLDAPALSLKSQELIVKHLETYYMQIPNLILRWQFFKDELLRRSQRWNMDLDGDWLHVSTLYISIPEVRRVVWR
jgi:hypothetical protein